VVYYVYSSTDTENYIYSCKVARVLYQQTCIASNLEQTVRVQFHTDANSRKCFVSV